MWKAKDFQKCIFNPTEKSLLDAYPVLAEISGDERLLRYIIAMYDPNSPLILKFTEIKRRKQEAAVFAGYDMEADSEELQAIFSLRGERDRPDDDDDDEEDIEGIDFDDEEIRIAGSYLKPVFDFLTKHAFPKEWFMICCNEQLFWEYGERMLAPIDKFKTNIEKDFIAALVDKEKLATAQETVSKRIDELYRKMFGGDTEAEQVQQKRRYTRPEALAS